MAIMPLKLPLALPISIFTNFLRYLADGQFVYLSFAKCDTNLLMSYRSVGALDVFFSCILSKYVVLQIVMPNVLLKAC